MAVYLDTCGGGFDEAHLYSATATEPLGVGDLLSIYNDGGVLKVRAADSALARPVHGFSTAAYAIDDVVDIHDFGTVTGKTGLTTGADYWLGPDGGLLDLANRTTTSGHIDQYVGVALSATALRFQPYAPVAL